MAYRGLKPDEALKLQVMDTFGLVASTQGPKDDDLVSLGRAKATNYSCMHCGGEHTALEITDLGRRALHLYPEFQV